MSEGVMASGREAIDITADIVSAYVSNNSVPAAELPDLLRNVHASLSALNVAETAQTETVEKKSAAEIRKSISHDGLVSFEDGKTYKTLKRHLTLRGLSPEAYRTKWGLSPDYPMVAASYSEQRSQLAHQLGLGQQRRKTTGAQASA